MEEPEAPSSFAAPGPSLRAAPLGSAVLRSEVDRRPYHLLYLVVLLLVLLLGMAYWRDQRLPEVEQLLPQIADEPIQQATTLAPFDRTIEGVTYHLVPMASYDIKGLIVSEHDSKVWWDTVHRHAHDFINVNDLCVVWGADAVTGLYREVSFSNSEFTCDWQYPSTPLSGKFEYDGVSNNHMLTEDRYLARSLRALRVGDQVRITGYLVNYANSSLGPDSYRNTSLSRTDTGNGACEVMYVKDLYLLHAGTRLWLFLKYLCALGLMACIVVWFALPYRGRP